MVIDEAEPRAARRSIRWVENNTHWSAIGSSLRWSAIRPVTTASFILTSVLPFGRWTPKFVNIDSSLFFRLFACLSSVLMRRCCGNRFLFD